MLQSLKNCLLRSWRGFFGLQTSVETSWLGQTQPQSQYEGQVQSALPWFSRVNSLSVTRSNAADKKCYFLETTEIRSFHACTMSTQGRSARYWKKPFKRKNRHGEKRFILFYDHYTNLLLYWACPCQNRIVKTVMGLYITFPHFLHFHRSNNRQQ